MSSNYSTVIPLVLAHEGGYVNHPKDPGGATNKGVTQGTYDSHRRRKGLPKRSVRQITEAEVQEIYRTQYWDKVAGDELPAGVDYAVFDFAVNSGPSRAVKVLQRIVGAAVDGIIGDETISKTCAAAAADEEALIVEYCNRRLAFMKSLRTWSTFGKGWSRRVMGAHHGFQETDEGVIDYAIRFARDDQEYGFVQPVPETELPAPIGAREEEEAPAKALEGDQAIEKTGVGAAGVVTVAATAGQEVIPKIIEQLTPAKDASETVAAIIQALLVTMAILGAVAALIAYRNKLKERS